jgi:hypothetical protein
MSVIFESLIDEGPGKVIVTEAGDRTARLEVFYGDELIYVESDLPLMYGAIFGVDVEDMNRFQAIALREHDAYVAQEGHDAQQD